MPTYAKERAGAVVDRDRESAAHDALRRVPGAPGRAGGLRQPQRLHRLVEDEVVEGLQLPSLLGRGAGGTVPGTVHSVTVRLCTVPELLVEVGRRIFLSHAADVGNKGDEVAALSLGKAVVALLSGVDGQRAVSAAFAGGTGAAILVSVLSQL